MTMVFERVLTKGIAQLSYLIGDDNGGTAAVIDPHPDCDVYPELAREKSVAITHVLETHIHADFMSGSRELADRLGLGPEGLYLSEEGGANYGFEHRAVRDGETFEFGSVMAYGARMAGGCTSGHGISGTLQLAVGSWVAVICFFVGGIATAMLLYRL